MFGSTAHDRSGDDARGSTAMAATGHMRPLVPSDGDAAEQEHLICFHGEGRTGGGGTHPSLAARQLSQLCMASAAAAVDAACSAGPRLLVCMLPATRGARDQRGRHLPAASSSPRTCLSGRSDMSRFVCLRRCRAATGRQGPVVAWSDSLVPLVVVVAVAELPDL